MKNNSIIKICISLAKQSLLEGDVPVGAVVERNGKIIGQGRNIVNKSKIGTHHAEILAINDACEHLGEWRLIDCTLYVTLEPCLMCVGAINNCRLKKVVYGADNHFFGAIEHIDPKIEVLSGIMKQECSDLLSDFFKKLRSKR